MLRIYPVILDWIETLPPIIASIRQSNASLAKQLQRSSMAVALNVSEGMVQNDGRRLNAYRIALAHIMHEAKRPADEPIAWPLVRGLM